MKKFISVSLMGLGVIFIIIVLLGIGFYVAMTMGIGANTFVPDTSESVGTEGKSTTNTQTSGTTFTLSDTQKRAIASFGINPETVPTTISTEQEKCFNTALGSARVTEIRDGAIPSALDFFKVKSCI